MEWNQLKMKGEENSKQKLETAKLVAHQIADKSSQTGSCEAEEYLDVDMNDVVEKCNVEIITAKRRRVRRGQF